MVSKESKNLFYKSEEYFLPPPNPLFFSLSPNFATLFFKCFQQYLLNISVKSVFGLDTGNKKTKAVSSSELLWTKS